MTILAGLDHEPTLLMAWGFGPSPTMVSAPMTARSAIAAKAPTCPAQ
jgi:hypothetical protein